MELFALAALGAGLMFAFSIQTEKYALTHKMKDFVSWSIFASIVATVLFVAVGLLFFKIELSLPIILLCAWRGFFSGVGYLCYAYGLFKGGDLSTAGVVFSAGIIFGVPFGAIFFKEFYGIDTVFWICVVLAGALICSWNEKMRVRQLFSKKNTPFFWFLFAEFLWNVGYLSVKPALQATDLVNFTVVQEVFATVFIIALLPVLGRFGNVRMIKRDWKATLPVGLASSATYFVGLAAMYFAFAVSFSIGSTLLATEGVFSVVLGMLTGAALRIERHNARTYGVRIAGALLVILGVYFISQVPV